MWCAGGRCSMACSDEDHGRSRRPDAEDRGWSHRSGTQWPGDREVGWRCVWSAPCTWRREAWVSWLIIKTKGDGFSQFGLKTGGSGFLVWASKPAAPVWWFGPQNHRDGFLIWASKPCGSQFFGGATKLTEGGRRGIRIEIWRLSSPESKSH
jgi:hypothetical protein